MSQAKKRKLACYLCQKDNQGIGCDGGRPCSTCKERNMAHVCFGLEIGEGRNFSSTDEADDPTPIPVNRRVATEAEVEEVVDDGPVITEQPPSAEHNSPMESTPTQMTPNAALPSFAPLSSPFNGMVRRPLKVIPSTFSEVQPPPKTTEPAQQEKSQLQSQTQTQQQPTQSTQQTPQSTDNRQNNLNLYFMKELCKLKNDQKRLDEQLLELKLENSNLTTTLKNSQFQVMRLMEYFTEMAERQQHHVEMHQPPLPGDTRKPLPALSLPNRTSSPDMMQIPSHDTDATVNLSTTGDGVRRRGARTEQPMVVYDITKNTATVLTANATFCELLGYEMNEVIGMPWNKFIPPDAVARTMEILRQTDLNSVFQVEQVYRHKTSGVFTTLDTHTILFGNDGSPISDVVVLHLPGQAPTASTVPAPLIPTAKGSVGTSATAPGPIFAPTAPPRKYLGWKKSNPNPSTATTTTTNASIKKKRPSKAKAAASHPSSSTATATTHPKPARPASSVSPVASPVSAVPSPPPSGIYPLTPMPVPSSPLTPFFSLPLPDIGSYPVQNLTPSTNSGNTPNSPNLTSSPSSFLSNNTNGPTSPFILNDTTLNSPAAQPGGVTSPAFFFQPFPEEDLQHLNFQQRMNISTPSPTARSPATTTTTTTTASSSPTPGDSSGQMLQFRNIVDEMVEEEQGGTGGADEGFTFADSEPGGGALPQGYSSSGVEQDDTSMTGLEQMDMDSILQHFLNMG